MNGPPEPTEVTRSTRDIDRTGTLLEAWLATQLPSGADPQIVSLVSPERNGMSSETLLIDAEWDGTLHPLVARVAPEDTAVPVFPTYDLHRQFLTMRAVAAHTKVPVPTVLWSEPTGSAIGSPFFVMERVEGVVPPDLMPYNMGDSWLYDASPADQAQLQEASVAVVAALHQIEDAPAVFDFLPGAGAPSALRAHVDAQRAYYEWAVRDIQPLPLIDRMFAWIEKHWPGAEGPTVLSWGDSRIGNIMYRDFEPVAVLDWEMAALAPPEMDVAWMIFMHAVFEDIAQTFALGGMPDFMRADDVLATYERLSGYAPRDLDFYLVYQALRWGIVSIRTQLRQIHFGEATMPDDLDDLIMTRSTLERLI